MARREKGSGSVYRNPRTKQVRWVGEITLGGRRHQVAAPTKTEAQAKLVKLRTEHESGTLPTGKPITVTQAVDQFIERRLPNMASNGRPLAPSTIATYTWAATIIRDQIGTVRLTKLTVQQVERMLDRLSADGMSKASLTKLRIKLGQFIAFAESRDQVRQNVAKLAELPAEAKPREERRSLTPDDARTLLEALRATRNGAQYGLSLLMGLRPGEAGALYWDDLDLDSDPATVNVTRGLQRDGGLVIIVDDLKTAGSKRTLALPDTLVEWLKDHRRTQLAERLAADSWIDERLVFTTPTGGVTDPARVRRDLDAICQTAEVPAVRPNELRHSCASLLADQGVRFETIADLLGHESTRMLESTYRHRLRPVIDVATTAAWIEAT